MLLYLARRSSVRSSRSAQDGIREHIPYARTLRRGTVLCVASRYATIASVGHLRPVLSAHAASVIPIVSHKRTFSVFAEKGATLTDFKDSRAQSRLEKAARETAIGGLHYEVEARAVREKIARLRALRIAKETEERSAALDGNVTSKKSIAKKPSNQPRIFASPLDRSMAGLRD